PSPLISLPLTDKRAPLIGTLLLPPYAPTMELAAAPAPHGGVCPHGEPAAEAELTATLRPRAVGSGEARDGSSPLSSRSCEFALVVAWEKGAAAAGQGAPSPNPARTCNCKKEPPGGRDQRGTGQGRKE